MPRSGTLAAAIAGLGCLWALPAAAERLFVLQKHAEVLVAYDPATGDRSRRVVNVRPVPHEMLHTADGRELYVTNYGVKSFKDEDHGANTILVVDARRMTPAGAVDLGENHRPHGIARGRSGHFYVTTDFPAA